MAATVPQNGGKENLTYPKHLLSRDPQGPYQSPGSYNIHFFRSGIPRDSFGIP